MKTLKFYIFNLCLVLILCCYEPDSLQARDEKALPPVNEAGVTNDEIIAWVPLAVVETLSLDFHNHKERLEKSSRNFTKKG